MYILKEGSIHNQDTVAVGTNLEVLIKRALALCGDGSYSHERNLEVVIYNRWDQRDMWIESIPVWED